MKNSAKAVVIVLTASLSFFIISLLLSETVGINDNTTVTIDNGEPICGSGTFSNQR